VSQKLYGLYCILFIHYLAKSKFFRLIHRRHTYVLGIFSLGFGNTHLGLPVLCKNFSHPASYIMPEKIIPPQLGLSQKTYWSDSRDMKKKQLTPSAFHQTSGSNPLDSWSYLCCIRNPRPWRLLRLLFYQLCVSKYKYCLFLFYAGRIKQSKNIRKAALSG
jgi:hypothetical protein